MFLTFLTFCMTFCWTSLRSAEGQKGAFRHEGVFGWYDRIKDLFHLLAYMDEP